jgi:hypothetical protein
LPSADYYLKQAQIAARLALAESNPDKARALHFLVLDYYAKADKGEGRRSSQGVRLRPPQQWSLQLVFVACGVGGVIRTSLQRAQTTA